MKRKFPELEKLNTKAVVAATSAEKTPILRQTPYGHRPVFGRSPEDEDGVRSCSDEESSLAPKISTELYRCWTSAGLCDWAISAQTDMAIVGNHYLDPLVSSVRS